MSHPDARLIEQTRTAMDWWESLSMGPTSSVTGRGAIAHLEEQFSLLMEARPCLALPSGTMALVAALVGVGVARGDQVICSAYDWSAATTAIQILGATPCYARPTSDTLTIDPTHLAELITPATTAVIATHPYGIPADIPALTSIAAPYEIPIVEDAAQALGATLDGQAVGTLASAAAFSFGPGKTIDVGEGGITVFADLPRRNLAMQATQHPVRQLLGGLQPSHPMMSARMAPIIAVLAAHQLGQLQPLPVPWPDTLVRGVECVGCRVLGNDSRRTLSGDHLVVALDNTDAERTLSDSDLHVGSLGIQWWPRTAHPGWLDRLRLLTPASTGSNPRIQEGTGA